MYWGFPRRTPGGKLGGALLVEGGAEKSAVDDMDVVDVVEGVLVPVAREEVLVVPLKLAVVVDDESY